MSTENKLRINPKLKEAYIKFINKYIELATGSYARMEQVPIKQINDKLVFYTSHHAADHCN